MNFSDCHKVKVRALRTGDLVAFSRDGVIDLCSFPITDVAMVIGLEEEEPARHFAGAADLWVLTGLGVEPLHVDIEEPCLRVLCQ